MTKFDDAFKKAEAALLARKSGRVNVPPQSPDVYADKDGRARAKVAPRTNRLMLNIDGVDVPSRDYVDNELVSLRKDFNEVLDGFEGGTSAPREIHIISGDVQIGTVDGLVHYQFDTLLKLCSMRTDAGRRLNILMKGDMGGGKSTALKQAADALGLEFGYVEQTLMPHNVMGYMHPVTNEYHWTPFTKAFVNGGLCAFEELDGWSPNATLAINAPLANGYIQLPNGEMHDRHKDCVLVACTNTWGTGPTAEYVGRNKLDDAFLDRFGAKIDWKYDLELERSAAGNDEVVDIVQQARRNAKRAGIKVVISPRSSIDVSMMVAGGFTVREALELNFLSSLDADQRRMVLEDTGV